MDFVLNSLKDFMVFCESPWPYFINGAVILAYLMASKKAHKNATHECRCLDSRIGGGNLLGGAAALSFGIPPLIIYLICGIKFFWTLFTIQIIYSVFGFITVVLPKLLKQGSVRVESHAGVGVSLCGMVAVLNIGPIYWVSKIPVIGLAIYPLVDVITIIHHLCATPVLAILGAIFRGKITTGFSEPVKKETN